MEDLRDSLSSSSSLINEDYSLNVHTHDIYDDPEFHPSLEDLGEFVTFWKSLKLRNEDVYKKGNYKNERICRKEDELECPVYPVIVNVDSKPKDNSEEQYKFIQNCIHTQELDNDEHDEEYDRDCYASSDHEHGKHKTDDEEYESNGCDNSDHENGRDRYDEEYEMDHGDSSYDEDEDG